LIALVILTACTACGGNSSPTAPTVATATSSFEEMTTTAPGVSSALSSAAVSTPVPIAGWASATKYRWADTTVRIRIVTSLMSFSNGASSGRSMMTTPTGSTYKTWETDVEPGSRTLAQAVAAYRAWLVAGKKPQTLAQIRQGVIASL